MIQITAIQAAVKGLVGWKQPTSPDVPELNTDNQVSRSGLYFNDASGLITLDNICSVIEQGLVEDAEKFNDYLADRAAASATKVLDAVASQMQPDLIETAIMYRQATQWTDYSNLPTAGFVGVEINLADRTDLMVEILPILEFADSITPLQLVVFNANKVAGVVKSITVTGNQQSTGSVITLSGGDLWYVGYLTSGITARPINRSWGTASRRYIYRSCVIRPVQVTNHTTTNLFDLDQVQYPSDTFGINLKLTAYKDYTEIIERSASLFARAILLQSAVDWLSMMVTSPRSNRDERLIKEAQISLEGIEAFEMIPGRVGLIKQLASEIASLKSKVFYTPQIKTVCTT